MRVRASITPQEALVIQGLREGDIVAVKRSFWEGTCLEVLDVKDRDRMWSQQLVFDLQIRR